MADEKKAPQGLVQTIASAAQRKASELGDKAVDTAQKAATIANDIRKKQGIKQSKPLLMYVKERS